MIDVKNTFLDALTREQFTDLDALIDILNRIKTKCAEINYIPSAAPQLPKLEAVEQALKQNNKKINNKNTP